MMNAEDAISVLLAECYVVLDEFLLYREVSV